jgi:hypothetical protein
LCHRSATTWEHAWKNRPAWRRVSSARKFEPFYRSPAAWEDFDATWRQFLDELNLDTWRHRDFCNRRKGYGSLTDDRWIGTRDKLCKLLIDAQFFIAGTAIGRRLYEKVRATRKWRLPADPYKFCLERCLHQVTKRIYSSHEDRGVRIFYDAPKQHGRIARELLRWHRQTFEPSYLSQFKTRDMLIEFDDGGVKGARAIPDIIAFEACEYVRADTGIPFLGAKFTDRPTPEPRPIIKALFESHRVPLAVVTYADWYLDFDLEHAGDSVGEVPPKAIAWD